jgi:sugar phosphate isomerase/epimerase
VFIAASTECFESLPLVTALERLVELEFSSVEIAIHEDGGQLRPSEVAQDLEKAVSMCRFTHRLDLIAYSLRFQATGEDYYDQFTACCRLAKATKVVQVTVHSGEVGTPFNEEVERLRRLVAIATHEGVRVSIKNEIGRLSEDPDTLIVLCDNVPGLGVTFDPSHHLCGSFSHKNADRLMRYTYHVHLRDSTRKHLQVRVGQGEIEYGRIITQLRRCRYNRALSVNITEMPEVDHMGEMRKMRLLLESLI